MASQLSSSIRRSSSMNMRRVRSPKAVSKITLLRAFDSGDFGLFFRHWPSLISDARNDPSVRHLDFYIRVYFATHHFRESVSKAKSEPFNKAMENFKTYLESSVGVELSKSADLTPYFALPYVKNIERHPLFKDLKNQKWVSLIRRKLIDFIDSKFGEGDGATTVGRAEEETDDIGEENAETLKERLAIAERKQMFYKNRCNQLQVNYHRLILVASELVDALEQTIEGTLVTPEQVEDLRSRMFDTRVGGAVSSGRTISTEDEDRMDNIAQGKEAPDDPEPSTTAISESELKSTNDLPSDIIDPDRIDWQKIKARLAESTMDKEDALLLQALRWALTKCENVETRSRVATAMSLENILSIETFDGGSIWRRAVICDDVVLQETTARFLNALSSLKLGRKYLLRDREFLPVLVEVVRTDQISPIVLCHILVTLQKCSVRRKVQLRLIRLSLLKWLIEYLRSHNKTLSSYALEYGAALLMNLSLTTSGKKAAAEDPELILNLLCELLEHEDAYVISPYVNGTLFSVLSLANVRFKAKKMGLYNVLDKVMQRPKTASDTRQIPFIIKQLNGELADKQPPPSDDECSSSADYKEYDSDSEDEITLGGHDQSSELLESELDDGETLAPDSVHPLAGFELLSAGYSKSVQKAFGGNEVKELIKFSGLSIEKEPTQSTTVSVKTPLRHQRPQQRRFRSADKEKLSSRSTARALPGYRKNKAVNGETFKPIEYQDVEITKLNGGRSAALSSSTYIVRSADSRSRSQRPNGRNSIATLPHAGRRRSLASWADDDFSTNDQERLDIGISNDVWPFPAKNVVTADTKSRQTSTSNDETGHRDRENGRFSTSEKSTRSYRQADGASLPPSRSQSTRTPQRREMSRPAATKKKSEPLLV